MKKMKMEILISLKVLLKFVKLVYAETRFKVSWIIELLEFKTSRPKNKKLKTKK